MSDLQKAAEMALEALDLVMSHGQSVQRAKDVLRQALAQPEQERRWVGITYDEVYEFVCTTDSYINFARAIEAKLKERNT